MAHDGSGWRSGGTARLAAGAGGLIATCACGKSGRVDPAAWLAEGLGDLPLRAFEGRLRCGCGARRVRLQLPRFEPSGVQEGQAPFFRFR